MSFSAEDLVARFAWEASLFHVVSRPEEASLASEARSPDHPPRALVPVLEPLLGQVDAVFVRGDGIHFEVVLVVDRTREPSRRFPLDRAAVQEACAPCVAFTGRLHGHPLPVGVLVLEIHAGGDDERERLRQLKGSAGEHKVMVRAAAVDTVSGKVTSFSRWPLGDELVRHLRHAATEVVAGRPAALPEPAPPVPRRRPIATLTLLGVLAGMFGAELVVDGSAAWWSPRPTTLYALGALSWPALRDDHALYRLLSCGFLHAGVLHLGLNGLALVLTGSFAERLAGPAFVLATFVAALLGGSLASLTVNGAHAFSVGASGAIMGLIGGALVLTRRMPFGPQRTLARARLWQWLIPALIPIAFRTGFGTIDFGAHLGGAVTGAVVGFLLLRSWNPRRPWPHAPDESARRWLRATAWTGSLLATLAVGWAVARSPAALADATLEERLMSDETAGAVADRLNQALRDGDATAKVSALAQELAELRRRYPDDPRTFYLGGLWALAAGQDAEGESLLRQGLAHGRILARAFGQSELELDMRRHLARSELRRGDVAAARRDFEPACRLLPKAPMTAGQAEETAPKETPRGTPSQGTAPHEKAPRQTAQVEAALRALCADSPR
jgi:rhomboid protease GluP